MFKEEGSQFPPESRSSSSHCSKLRCESGERRTSSVTGDAQSELAFVPEMLQSEYLELFPELQSEYSEISSPLYRPSAPSSCSGQYENSRQARRLPSRDISFPFFLFCLFEISPLSSNHSHSKEISSLATCILGERFILRKKQGQQPHSFNSVLFAVVCLSSRFIGLVHNFSIL